MVAFPAPRAERRGQPIPAIAEARHQTLELALARAPQHALLAAAPDREAEPRERGMAGERDPDQHVAAGDEVSAVGQRLDSYCPLHVLGAGGRRDEERGGARDQHAKSQVPRSRPHPAQR